MLVCRFCIYSLKSALDIMPFRSKQCVLFKLIILHAPHFGREARLLQDDIIKMSLLLDFVKIVLSRNIIHIILLILIIALTDP